MIIELLKVIFLGIVQGITEWLPISSTGHMILVDEFIRLQVSPEFMLMFLVVIQFGSIMAVVVLYFHKLNPFPIISPKKSRKQVRSILILWSKVLVATIPAAIIGLLFDDVIHGMFYNYTTVAAMLVFYGILFIVIENRNKDKEPRVTKLSDLPYQTALMIGLFQVLALIPGTSRSGATILGALLIGTSRFVATEFTFFLAIPVMFGASLLQMVRFGWSYSIYEVVFLLVGCVVAFFVSLFAIKFLLNYIKRNNFKAFGYYRIVLGAIVLVYGLIWG